jgi:glycosyltransferase involved in cell wall biosynthesis
MRKRVIIFNPSIEGGGVEKNLYIISNYLKNSGILVEILTCNINKSNKFEKGIKFIGTKSLFWQNKSRFIKYLVCTLILFCNIFIKKDKPLVFSFQANIYALIVAKILNTKIITRSNSAPIGWSGNVIKKNIYKFLINLSNQNIVNSLEFRRCFQKNFNVKSVCIYNPFDKKLIKNNLKKKTKIKFFKKNFLNLISVGRLTDQKDHMTLLKSIKLLNSKLNVRLIILGKGKNKTMLQNFIIKNKLQNKIKLLGYVNNPYHYINKSDIVILTSIFEGLPNILLEAQYFKKYIISTKCLTGPSEILLNGKAGDLIRIGDYKKLSFLINNYNNNQKIINEKIKNGISGFKRFDYNLNCQKYLTIVNKNLY